MTAPGAPVGRLTVCPTPIGNLADITLRALEELAAADVIACEDTRRTRVLLDRHGIAARSLVSLHEHNEAARARELAGRIGAGEHVVLVSDAGTPLVSDPGHALLRECLRDELPVEVLPGASAAITALVASGCPVRAGASSGSFRASAASCASCSPGRGRPLSPTSPRAVSRRRLRCSPRSMRTARWRSAVS